MNDQRILLLGISMLSMSAGCAPTEQNAGAPRGKVAAGVADRSPRLVGDPPWVQIELPPPMTRVLAAGDTSFTTLTPSDFVSAIVPGDTEKGAWRYPYDGRQAPFAVIADLDGDGNEDVALLQRSKARGRVIAVLNRGDEPRVVLVKEWDRVTAGEMDKSGFYVSRFPAGPFKVPDYGGSGDTATVLLEHEGVEVSNYGKAATTFCWADDETFESVITGD